MAGKKAKTVRHWCAKVVSHWSSKPARTWDRLAISICNKAIRTLATLAAMQCFREVYNQQLCVDQQCSQLLLSFSFWCSSGCKNSWQVSVPHKQIGFRTLNYLWAYLWVRICVWPPRETPRRRGTAGNRLCPKGGSNRLSIIIIPTLSHGWQEKQPCHAFPHRGAYTQCCKNHWEHTFRLPLLAPPHPPTYSYMLPHTTSTLRRPNCVTYYIGITALVL